MTTRLRNAGDILAAIGRSGFVAAGVFVFGWSPVTAALLYLLETYLGIFFAIVAAILRAPKQEDASQKRPLHRRCMVQTFLVCSVFPTLVQTLFLLYFIFQVYRRPLNFAEIQSGVLGILIFEAYDFLWNILSPGPLPLIEVASAFGRLMGRVALLFFAIFGGVFVGVFFNDYWFLYPFVILKSAVDVGSYLIKSPKKSAEEFYRRMFRKP